MVNTGAVTSRVFSKADSGVQRWPWEEPVNDPSYLRFTRPFPADRTYDGDCRFAYSVVNLCLWLDDHAASVLCKDYRKGAGGLACLQWLPWHFGLVARTMTDTMSLNCTFPFVHVKSLLFSPSEAWTEGLGLIKVV